MIDSLDELEHKTNLIWGKPLQIPEPPESFKTQLKGFEEEDLDTQWLMANHQVRVWKAKEMGFVEIEDLSDLVRIMMGESHSKYIHSNKSSGRKNFEYIYFDTENIIKRREECDWGENPPEWSRVEKVRSWFNPFSRRTTWKVQETKLPYIDRLIPETLISRIGAVKRLKLFNFLSVLTLISARDKNIIKEVPNIVLANLARFDTKIKPTKTMPKKKLVKHSLYIKKKESIHFLEF